jgi:hypothetical protein
LQNCHGKSRQGPYGSRPTIGSPRRPHHNRHQKTSGPHETWTLIRDIRVCFHRLDQPSKHTNCNGITTSEIGTHPVFSRTMAVLARSQYPRDTWKRSRMTPPYTRFSSHAALACNGLGSWVRSEPTIVTGIVGSPPPSS